MVVEEDTADLGLPGPSEVPSGSGVTEGGRSGARRGRGWAVIIADGRGRRGERLDCRGVWCHGGCSRSLPCDLCEGVRKRGCEGPITRLARLGRTRH